MRRSLLLILAGALMLLLVSVSSGYAGHTRALTRDRNELAYDAAKQAQVLNAYFERARSIILLTAHVPEFGKFYALPGTRADRIRRGGPVLDEINGSLSYLEQLYPDRIGEACFIDASGAEIARTVDGRRATYSALSPDESTNPFFGPTFALRPGEVHQAKPYVSPDTGHWVISNSTPIPSAGGTKAAIVHFEVTLESFRREAMTQSMRTVLVVDADTGQVVLNSLHPQQAGAPLGDPSDSRFRGLVRRWAAGGSFSIGGHQAAYQRIAAAPGNANHWFVVSIDNDTTDPFTGVGFLPVLLVVATLLLIGLLLVAMRRAQRALVHAAQTDALTGLGNRRQLAADLEAGLARATNEDPLLLALYDLNGFKQYNDMFGHPAGDALLARMGAALCRAVETRGRAYRIGGDEFCVLAPGGPDGVVEAAAAALSEHGEGFSITASYGSVLLPADAAVATEAMRAVDLRMYENKPSSRVPADLQTTNVLVRAVQERDHEWAERLRATADLAARVCERLGVPAAEQARIRLAAQLHDVGKVGIPDAILHKPGPLDCPEWDFVQQVPTITERIVSCAPALASVAPLVRAAHERFDGTGYPDGLSGEDIPLGARIIAACVALEAMISERPYTTRMETGEALDELQRAAGTQFDPQVVAALSQAVRRPVAG